MTRTSGRRTPGPNDAFGSNFVTTIDGRIQGPDGLSGTISSPEDRRVFHMLRAGADAILVGAGTARIENYKPLGIKREWLGWRGNDIPPKLIIVSASGHVPDIEGSVVVDGSDLASLKDRYPRILCEGGPHLFTALLEQGLVDEVALSTHGRLGGTGALITDGVTADATPRHSHHDADGLYTLWSLT